MCKALGAGILLILLTLPVVATAQNGNDGPGFRGGDVELTLSGTGTSDKDVRTTDLSADLSLGYFFTSALEAALRQGVTYLDPDGGSDQFTGSTRFAIDLHLPLARLYPFVGGNIGYIYGDNVNDQFIGGPEAGVKLFLTESAFAFAQAEYQFMFERPKEADEAFRHGRFVYGIGLGARF